MASLMCGTSVEAGAERGERKSPGRLPCVRIDEALSRSGGTSLRLKADE